MAPLSPDLEAEVAPLRDHRDTVKFVYAKGEVPVGLVERIAAELVALRA